MVNGMQRQAVLTDGFGFLRKQWGKCFSSLMTKRSRGGATRRRSDRSTGASLWTALNVNRRVWNSIQSITGSQWSWLVVLGDLMLKWWCWQLSSEPFEVYGGICERDHCCSPGKWCQGCCGVGCHLRNGTSWCIFMWKEVNDKKGHQYRPPRDP